MRRRLFQGALTIASALVVAATGKTASGQVAPSSPVYVTVNGVFYLCPELVRTNLAPGADWLSSLGFQPNSASDPSKFQFSAIDPKGSLTVNYDTVVKRCTVHYVGAGYEQIAGAARDVIVRSKLTRLTGGSKDGAKADVYEGPVPKVPNLIARFIVLENLTTHSAAISYTERAKP